MPLTGVSVRDIEVFGQKCGWNGSNITGLVVHFTGRVLSTRDCYKGRSPGICQGCSYSLPLELIFLFDPDIVTPASFCLAMAGSNEVVGAVN